MDLEGRGGREGRGERKGRGEGEALFSSPKLPLGEPGAQSVRQLDLE